MVDARDGRERLAEALTRVVARGGVAGVSVRAVASEAGVSGGTVQHYFRTRAEMIRYAMEWISGRVEHRLAGVARWGDVRVWTRQILLELLPLDEQRQREHAVWLAFVAHAGTDSSLVGLRRRTDEKLVELYARIVRARRSLPPAVDVGTSGNAGNAKATKATKAAGASEVSEPGPMPEADVAQDALLLQALLDGLSLRLTVMPPDEARRRGPVLLDRYLDLAVDSATQD